MQPSSQSTADGTGRTILMVEDDANVMDVGATILADCGHVVVAAATADDALEKVRGGLAFDLLFSDIVMPGDMNGVALASEVRRLMPEVPILLTSGWADRALEHEEEREGFAFIGKPYRHADLSRKVQVLLEGDGTPG